MPSTYSNLKIQLMATGENSTTWGNVTNVNLGTAIEEAIVGSADVTFASNNQTLTLTDTNASQTARNMRLRCTGTTGGSTRNLVVPSIEKPYIVQNDCADSVVVKTSAGTGITVPAGKTTWVYSDGTNVVDAVNYLSDLTVNGAITAGVASGATLLMADNSAIRNTATGGNTMYFDSGVGAGSTTGDFNFRSTASYTSRLYINGTTGNVGIGTSSPVAKLDVTGSVETTFAPNVYNTALLGTAASTSGNAGSGVAFRGYYTGTTAADLAFVSGIKENNTDGNYAGALVFGTRTNGSGGGSFERMRITSAGNVGIGTATPGGATKLNVSGRGLFTSGDYDSFDSTAPGVAICYDTVNNVGIVGTVHTGILEYETRLRGNTLTFYTNGTNERMRVTSGGSVGIGTTSPAYQFQVESSTAGYNGMRLINTSSSASAVTLLQLGNNTNAAAAAIELNSGANSTNFGGVNALVVRNGLAYPLVFAVGGSEFLRIGTSGQLGLGGANYGTSGQALISQGAGSAAVWGSPSSVASGATIDGVTIGYRSIPRSTTTTTAVVGDVGKCIAVSAGITIPNATFAAGDALSIYNDSGSAITITAGVTTLRQAGTANTGNRTLAARGMATIWFNSSTEAIISGAGIS